MAQLVRIVIPNYPHHIIQRGNRKQRVFFSDRDKKMYIDILCEHAKKYDVTFWAYCLHVKRGKDILLSDNFMLSSIKDWYSYLSEEDKESDKKLLRQHSCAGRPLGDNNFITKLEKITGRAIRKQKTGPKGNN